MRVLTSAALLFLLSATLAAQQIDAVEMAPATLEQLARASVVQPPGELEKRPRPARAAKRSTRAAIAADFVTVANGIPAPPLTRGFKASFDPLPGATTGYAPPDVSGAVGPRHVVGAFNNSLTVHDRNGNQLSFLSIYQFWHDPAFPDTTLTDPRVMYDALNDRWALAMLTDTNGRLGLLLLAFSATGDPTGSWRRFRIAANPSSPNIALDFTRMALTLDQIVVTANEFNAESPTGADVYTIAKSAAFSPLSTVSASLSHSASDFDLTPVTSPDTTIRIATQDGDDVLLYELRGHGLVITNEYAPPASFFNGATFCDQLGTTKTLDCGEGILHHALFRNNVLWIVQSAANGFSGIAVVWKIAGPAATGFVLSDPAVDYAYPSIAVNRFGAALVGYAMFNSSMYPSAAYRYIDPAGAVSDPVTVKNGEDWFGLFRWGDYTTTLVDPVDDTSFWTIQEYGTPANGTTHNTWGTWWTYVRIVPRMRAVRH